MNKPLSQENKNLPVLIIVRKPMQDGYYQMNVYIMLGVKGVRHQDRSIVAKNDYCYNKRPFCSTRGMLIEKILCDSKTILSVAWFIRPPPPE